MRAAHWILVLSSMACSSESTPPPIVVTPDPAPAPLVEAATPEAAAEIPPAAPVVPSAVPADATYSVLVLPDRVRLDTIPVVRDFRTVGEAEFMWGGFEAEYEVARHPDAGVRAALEAWSQAQIDSIMGEGLELAGIACDLPLATVTAVAQVCRVWNDSRGGGFFTIRTAMVRIENGQLIPFTMDQALAPRNEVHTRMRRRCESRFERDRGYDVSETCHHEFFVPDNAGLRAVYEPDDLGAPIEVTLPWSELSGLVRADGPLASLLSNAEHEEISVTGAEQFEARLSLSCNTGFLVSAPHSLSELASLVRRSALQAGDELRVMPAEEASHRLVLSRCIQSVQEAQPLAERAAALASALGEHAEAFSGQAPLLFRWVRVERSIALRDRGAREGSFVATLPTGLVMPALIGGLAEGQSSMGLQGTWARVFPTDAREGWSAGRYLRPSDAPPSAASILENVPEAHRAAAMQDAMIGDLSPYGAENPLYFVVASTPEPAVYWGVAVRGPDGTSSAPALSRAEGRYDEVAFVRSGGAPAAYALVGTVLPGAPTGTVHWQLFAPGASAAGWSLDAPTAASVPEGERATYATDVSASRRRYLVDFTLPDRTHVRVRQDGDQLVTD